MSITRRSRRPDQVNSKSKPANFETKPLEQAGLTGPLIQPDNAAAGQLPPSNVLQLQRIVGNRAVNRLLAQNGRGTAIRQRTEGDQSIQRLLSSQSSEKTGGLSQQTENTISRVSVTSSPGTGLIQRNGMAPPEAMAGMKLNEIQHVLKKFGEGTGAYLIQARGEKYVLKLSSDNPRAEVNTAQFGRMLGVPMPAAIPLEYNSADLEQLPETLVSDHTPAIIKKMRKNLDEKTDKGFAVVTGYIEGTSLNSSMGVDEGVPIPEQGTSGLKQRLEGTGKLESFFITLGKIAAFDLLVGHTDHFNFKGYRGNRSMGNLGNFMVGQNDDLAAIDLDLGGDALDEDQQGRVQSHYIEALKNKGLKEIIHVVLTLVSEGENDELLTGELALIPQAPGLVEQGINEVLARVKTLNHQDLSDITQAWDPVSNPYGKYLIGLLKVLGAAQE
jgi:hypothetical protein